jgi:hypothetical protein
MSNPIQDFVESSKTVHGCGFFEGDLEAVRLSQTMTRSQKNKYRKYGTVPKALYDYLKEVLGVERIRPQTTRCIKNGKSVAMKKDPTGVLLETLWNTRYKDETCRNEGRLLHDEILLHDFPELRKQRASSQNVWKRIEELRKH